MFEILSDKLAKVFRGLSNKGRLTEKDVDEGLRQVRVTRVWESAARAPGAVDLLSFSDGTPALSAIDVGAGRFVLANFSPVRAAGDLGRHGAFVAVVHALADHLQPRNRRPGQATLGEPAIVRLALPPDAHNAPSLGAIGPNGRPVRLDWLGAPSAAGRDANSAVELLLTGAAQPGFYRVEIGRRTLAEVAVNIDERESDLRRMDERELAGGFAAATNRTTALRTDGSDGTPLLVRGRSLWPWLLGAALLALGAEMALLAAWKR